MTEWLFFVVFILSQTSNLRTLYVYVYSYILFSFMNITVFWRFACIKWTVFKPSCRLRIQKCSLWLTARKQRCHPPKFQYTKLCHAATNEIHHLIKSDRCLIVYYPQPLTEFDSVHDQHRHSPRANVSEGHKFIPGSNNTLIQGLLCYCGVWQRGETESAWRKGLSTQKSNLFTFVIISIVKPLFDR